LPDGLGPQPDTPKIPPALLVVVNGFLVLVALSALVSIWFGRSGGG
jgi:putative membrane protein